MMGDNADGEVVVVRSIRLHCVEVWISAGLYSVYRYIVNDLMYNGLYSVYRYIVNDLMYNGLRLPRNLSEGNYCVSRGVYICIYLYIHDL
jgi:hypothetical protein